MNHAMIIGATGITGLQLRACQYQAQLTVIGQLRQLRGQPVEETLLIVGRQIGAGQPAQHLWVMATGVLQGFQQADRARVVACLQGLTCQGQGVGLVRGNLHLRRSNGCDGLYCGRRWRGGNRRR